MSRRGNETTVRRPRSRTRSGSIAAAIAVLLLAGCPTLRAGEAEDTAYTAAFLKEHPRVEHPPTLAEYATVEQYDKTFMGEALDRHVKQVHNDGGALAWSTSDTMQSLDQMFRTTGDAKYLEANLRVGQAILKVRDDKVGTKTWNGETLPAWSSGGYSARGRAVYLVHTGMIVYPLLDAIMLARTGKDVPPDLRRDLEVMLPALLESVRLHDRQWRAGPAAGEGYYIGLHEEPVMENRAQPFNRLSAIGRALWVAYVLTKEPAFHDKAIALGHYIKNRLPVADDGAYYWEYWLSAGPATRPVTRVGVNGEDTSHAGLSVSFPIMLAEAGEVFTADDIKHFGVTFRNGVGRLGGDGVLLGDVTGNPRSRPDHVGTVANYLRLRPFVPDIGELIVPYYLNFKPAPTPLELSLLIPLAKK